MNYDWDSLDVGNPWLDTSQNFFKFSHVLHERNATRCNIVNKGNKQCQQNNCQPHHNWGQEKQTWNSKHLSATKGNGNQTTISELGGDKHNKENTSAVRNRQIPIGIPRCENRIVKDAAEIELKRRFQKSLKITSSSSENIHSFKQVESKRIKDIETQSRFQLKKSFSSEIHNRGSRLFEYAEISRKKREELALKFEREQEEKLKFSSFHAQPVPKFIIRKSHSFAKLPIGDGRKPERKELQKQISFPPGGLERPRVQVSAAILQNQKDNLVPNCGDPEKIKFMAQRKKSLVEKYEVSQSSFRAKPAAVLKKQPFQPTYNPPKKAESKPFKLNLLERLSQRQEFNKRNMEAVNKRKNEEEMKKRQKDSQTLKLIRQKTEFKARPNPFRNAN